MEGERVRTLVASSLRTICVPHQIYGFIFKSIKRILTTKNITDSACKLRDKFIKPN